MAKKILKELTTKDLKDVTGGSFRSRFKKFLSFFLKKSDDTDRPVRKERRCH